MSDFSAPFEVPHGADRPFSYVTYYSATVSLIVSLDSAEITWFRNFLYLYLKPHEGDCGLVVRLRRWSWKVPSSKPESPSCIGPAARYIIRTGSDSPQLVWCGSLAREGRAQVPSSSSDRDSELHCEARI
ncbi:hypothetical protein AVEN_218049-1 [Araneus ventricosus]|uniref:Uncharacterized protein n=1 Tax=Araneus ventricosus TaxID=182803 RepID=A0A4Y2W2Y6_ARAVE|nr:hypothetical protein AVEN_236876-1 [Araneus ventricosus]GBO31339.1 hypothetical protein AVEN_15978-1 [Araneus ventricosus]GBO31342.1 hypothetical protein AVEN_40324-1 [Araneus ventricosus]GBO31343.1 hypothetical protein AVEN_218049-1 [Araneus ventricosus]